MKGWRPSASQRLETGSGSFKRTYCCRTSDQSPCLFPRSSVPGLMTRGLVRGQGSPFSRSSGSAAAESDKWRPSVRDLKTAPALRLLHETGGPRNEDRRNDKQPGVNKQPLRRRGAFKAGSGSKKGKGVGLWGVA